MKHLKKFENFAKPDSYDKYIIFNEYDRTSMQVKSWIDSNCVVVDCSTSSIEDILGLPDNNGGYYRQSNFETDKPVCFINYEECSNQVKSAIQKLGPTTFNGSVIELSDLQGLPI